MRVAAFLAAALALLAGAARADEDIRPHVTWVMAVPPPIHIPDRTGYADQTLDWFIARLPQFRHEVITANSKRLQEMLASGDGVCGAAMLATPERSRTTAFSKALYWPLPARLIVSAQRPAALDAHLNERGEVDLPALLADPRFTGGLQFGRSYGRIVDEALAQALASPGEGGLVSIRGPGHFDMLAGGRFDWTLGFPIEASWWARRLGASSERPDSPPDLAYLTRPIAGSTGLIPGYFGCSRRPVGLTVVAAVNRLVDEAGPNPPWLGFYLNWLDGPTRAEYLTAREAVR